MSTERLLREANLAYHNGNTGLAGYFTERMFNFRPLPVKAKETPNPPQVGKQDK